MTSSDRQQSDDGFPLPVKKPRRLPVSFITLIVALILLVALLALSY